MGSLVMLLSRGIVFQRREEGTLDMLETVLPVPFQKPFEDESLLYYRRSLNTWELSLA